MDFDAREPDLYLRVLPAALLRVAALAKIRILLYHYHKSRKRLTNKVPDRFRGGAGPSPV